MVTKSKSDRGPWMQTASGRKFYPLDPRPEEVHIEDIAHGLARIDRYSGHHQFERYSVAQHSLIVSQLVRPPQALAGLLHDAPECYGIGDMFGPMKPFMPDYLAVQEKIHNAIMYKFNLPTVLDPVIKYVDKEVGLREMELLVHTWPGDISNDYKKHSDFKTLDIVPISAQEAELAFKVRFIALTEGNRDKKDKAGTGLKVGKAAA